MARSLSASVSRRVPSKSNKTAWYLQLVVVLGVAVVDGVVVMAAADGGSATRAREVAQVLLILEGMVTTRDFDGTRTSKQVLLQVCFRVVGGAWLFGLPFLVNVHVMLDCLPNRSRVRWVLGYKKPEILSKLAIFFRKVHIAVHW